MRVCRRLGTAVAALGFMALAWTPPTLAQDIKRFRAWVACKRRDSPQRYATSSEAW